MHPYKAQPDSAFWSRAVSTNWRPVSLRAGKPLLQQTDRISSFGSCFAANLVPYLLEAGYDYIREEPRLPGFEGCAPENMAYDKFSAAYGNIYTARQLDQLLARCLGEWQPAEEPWPCADGSWADPFRPGMRYKARSRREYGLLTAQHLAAVRRVFEKSSVVIFTLGLTEAWRSKQDGAVFPSCPGTLAGEFDADRYEFVNFKTSEVVQDLQQALAKMRRIQAQIRLILSVSPVPLVATATGHHVLCASTHSKSVLRAACGELQSERDGIDYFPAYEIITGPQAPPRFFEADRRSVSEEGVNTVMRVFFAGAKQPVPTPQAARPEAPAMPQKSLADIECEEAGYNR